MRAQKRLVFTGVGGWRSRVLRSAREVVSTAVVGLSCLCAGCGGDAGLELAATDVLLAVADQMEVTVGEYHDEVSRYDDSRESAVTSAFVARVQKDAGDSSAMASHVAEFEAALRKIRADRETEWGRRTAAMDNVGVLREVARGLQRLALESLTLRDEVRRYLSAWIETRRRSETVGKLETENVGQ